MRAMEHGCVSFVSLAGQTVRAGLSRRVMGAGVSFCIHAGVVCAVYFLGPGLADFRPPLVIDFSIEQVARPAPVTPVPPPVDIPLPDIPPPPLRQDVILPETSLPRPMAPLVAPEIVAPETQEEVAREVVPPPVPVLEEEVAAEQPVAETEAAPVAQAVRKTSAPPPEETPSFRRERYYREHFQYIRDNVQSGITYPRIARKMGWQGRVVISFVICLDGLVRDIKVVESSGYAVLDSNAVEVVQRVAPFPKPPVAAELVVPVVYSLI